MKPADSSQFITPALDGARIVWRHWRSDEKQEGFVREFTADGRCVRISTTNRKSDAGKWYMARELRCEGVLDPRKAPKDPKKDETPSNPTPEEDES